MSEGNKKIRYRLHEKTGSYSFMGDNSIRKKRFPGSGTGISSFRYISLTVLLILLIFTGTDTRLRTVRYGIRDERIDQSVRIALITDLHSCRYGEGMKDLIDAVDREKPDVLILGGDIYDDVLEDDNTDTFLRLTGTRYPSFYVTGNHEYWSGRHEEFIGRIKGYGIKYLSGSGEFLKVKGNEIYLFGLDDPERDRYSKGGVPLKEQIKNAKEADRRNVFSVLIWHRPELAENFEDSGYDLILSGHAHGGQWRLPFILNGVYAPDQGVFPKYDGGIYEIGKSKLIVSRGLARESTRVPRIFNRPELVIIEISRADPKR